MIDLNKLIDLLPYYFKENDTYKDTQGKGILERFLEICGGYFDNQVVANTDILLDNLNVEDCPEHFLSYFWEWFGCIPFAEGEFIDPDKWAQYYNGFDSKETYEEKKKYWTFQDDEDPIPLTITQKRSILKYALSLLKCRGSRIFFETMFRLYGIEVIGIYDHAVDLNTQETPNIDPLPQEVPMTIPEMDDELVYLDNQNCMDEEYNCMQCIPVYFYIKYTGDNLSVFREAVLNFINKYIPFNAHPIVKFVDGSGTSVSGETHYLRVTNIQTGESKLSYTDHVVSTDWDFHSTKNFQLFYRVEAWSDIDPEGKDSSWFCLEGTEQVSDDTLIYPSNTIKVVQRSFANRLSFNFYNKQAYDEGSIVTVYFTLTIDELIIPGYSLEIQIWEKGECILTNPTTSLTLLGREVRVYAREYPNSNDKDVYHLTPIVISPSVSYENKGNHYLLDIPQSGQYRIALSKYPSLYKTLNVLPSSIRYKLKCVDEEGTEITEKINIPADQDTIKLYVLIEPEDSNIQEYSEVIGTSIQCINTGESYTVTRLDFGYGIEFTTAFKGIYNFRSLYNEDIEDDSLWATVDIGKLSNTIIAVTISPSYTRELDLLDTEDNEDARTLQYGVHKLYSTGINFSFNTQDPNQNGQIKLEIYDDINDTELSPTRKDWWGDDIDTPKSGLIVADTSYTATFNLKVPYKVKSLMEDGSEEGVKIPFTGVVKITYILPYRAVTTSGNRESAPRILIVKNTIRTNPGQPWAAIIPFNPNDEGWQLDWSTLYPQVEDGPKQTKAEYKKFSENDVCKFSLELNYLSTSSYTRYNLKNEDEVLEVVEGVDVTQTMSFSDPGRYVFTFDDTSSVEIIVRDFVPTFKVICTPSMALLESSYSQVTTRVSLTITPNKSTYTHQVKVLKLEGESYVETGEILNCSSPQTFVVTELSTYKFRSIDAESEDLTEEELEATDGIFTVTDKKGMIGSIVCDPATGSINEENTSASTVVRVYDKDGTELRDTAFLIRFPDGTENISGTTFTTSETGTHIFSAVIDPSIQGTFEVSDTSYKPAFGGVIVDPNSKSVSAWPFSEAFEIHFTAWDVTAGGSEPFSIPFTELEAKDLTVSYGKRGGSGRVPINFANPSGPRWNLYMDGSNQYHIIIQGLTLNEDTEVVLVPALNPNYRDGYDTFYIILDNPLPREVVLNTYESTNSKFPGVSNGITGNIRLSDSSVVSYEDWVSNYLEDTQVFMDASLLTYNSGSTPNEGEWCLNKGTGSIGFKVYLTTSTHKVHVNLVLENFAITSNVIRLNSTRDYSDVAFIMFSDVSAENKWEASEQVQLGRRGIGSNLSKFFWLTGGYDGDEFSHEPNDEKYFFSDIPENVTVECLDSGHAEVVSEKVSYSGVHIFRIADSTQGSPTVTLGLSSFSGRHLNITLDSYQAQPIP